MVRGHHYEDVREQRTMFVALEQSIVEKHTVQFRYSKTTGEARVRSAVELTADQSKRHLVSGRLERRKTEVFRHSRIDALLVDAETFIPRKQVEEELVAQ